MLFQDQSVTDADKFELQWEEVKSKDGKKAKKKEAKKAIYQVNWRWSRILGYHVPDTHDAI